MSGKHAETETDKIVINKKRREKIHWSPQKICLFWVYGVRTSKTSK